MPDKGVSATGERRIYFLDNLRTFMIFLVVLVHAGLVYESAGFCALFWIVDDYSTNILADYLNTFIDIFVMAVIFFVAGYFTPPSLKSKTSIGFLKTKLKRLMLPWGVAVLTLIPLYKVIFLYSRQIPQEHWSSYFHFTNRLFSQNWLWFLPVLFSFNLLYMLLGRLKIDLSKIPLRTAVIVVFASGYVYSVLLTVFGWTGWTKTALLDFQNEKLLTYFLVYLLGAVCFERGVFKSENSGRKLFYALLLTSWIPMILYRYFNVRSQAYPPVTVISPAADILIMWLCFYLALPGLLYVMVNFFRYYLDGQGKLARELSRNSYNVYIIHVVVVGGIATLLLNSGMPSLLKFAILTATSYLASNLIVSISRTAFRPLFSFFAKGSATMKTVIIALLAISMFSLAACGTQDKAAVQEEKSPAPPGVSLHIAALQGNLAAVRQHIQAGSDLNQKDQYGSTPLMAAITFGKDDVARALIDGGADLEIGNNDGSTPLHVAAFFCRTEIVEALLAKGADKNATNKDGRTPIESVTAPFEHVKPIYDAIEKGLAPLGLKLDYDRIREARPVIAEMLR